MEEALCHFCWSDLRSEGCDKMDQIKSAQDIQALLHKVSFFHDTCITELRYISGAYVTKQGMYPVNDKNNLEIILKGELLIRLVFHGILYCRLCPIQPDCTCEIFGASMWMDPSGRVYWCNDDYVTAENVDDYRGIVVCADSLEYETQKPDYDEATQKSYDSPDRKWESAAEK